MTSTTYWPFWAGALALAGVAVLHGVLVGRPLAVSGQISRVLDRFSPSRVPALLFLAAIAGGGLLGQLGDALAPGADGFSLGVQFAHTSQAAARFFGDGAGPWLALFGGGALVGFGTAMAGGCTSGHGLVGCARLQPASLVVTAAFFGTAVATATALTSLTGGAP